MKRGLRAPWMRPWNTTHSPPLRLPARKGGDSGRRAVRLGRHTPEKISGVPKARLRRVRNPP
jgi:hypothetical protein